MLSELSKTFYFFSHESGNTGSNGQEAVTVISLCILTKQFQGVINLELHFDFKVPHTTSDHILKMQLLVFLISFFSTFVEQILFPIAFSYVFPLLESQDWSRYLVRAITLFDIPVPLVLLLYIDK